MSRTDAELQQILGRLIVDWESEVVEFKNVGDNYSTSDIGKYLSALANEANLREANTAWLIFGVDNRTRQIVSSSYRRDRERLHSLKKQVADGTSPAICFREIHEVAVEGKRVLMMEVPPAPRGMPISWNGHFYARDGESLSSLSVVKQDQIREQTLQTDWSAEIVGDATTEHLVPEAIQAARQAFSAKHANRFNLDEVNSWSDKTFLDRARVTREGRITKAAILLLGKPESSHLLTPHPAQIVWKLVGPETGNEIFGPPVLLTTTALYRKIRNVQMRILPEEHLVAVEVAKYDQGVVLESLHNCIAHQEYRRNARIIVTEHLDKLVFENAGEFFEGEPLRYLTGQTTPSRYRNPFLASAMSELNMIDTMGYGIHRIYRDQARRYFPLPDYDLTEAERVKLTIPGTIVDPAYSRMLIERTDLPLEDVVALDRIQKRLPIDDEAIKRLRRAKLIEGRKPNLYVSHKIASATGGKADYIRTRPQDDAHYQQLILDYLRKFGSASRTDIDDLLLRNLSDVLDEQQKRTKIGNLLTGLRTAGKIRNEGSRGAPKWVRLQPSVHD